MTQHNGDDVEVPLGIVWADLDSNEKLRAHVWKVLRERVLAWEERGAYWLDREGECMAGIDFDPFDDESDAFFLFKMWDDCLQLYKLAPGGDYMLTITCSSNAVPGSVGQRAPTVARAMFRATVHYLHKKHIKWRPSV